MLAGKDCGTLIRTGVGMVPLVASCNSSFMLDISRGIVVKAGTDNDCSISHQLLCNVSKQR